MYRILIFIFIAHLQSSSLSAQYYELEAFQGEYNEIDDYNSLLLNIGGPTFFWSFRFDLNFEFPYFDSTYNFIYASDGGGLGFESRADYISPFTVEVTFDNDFDILDIESDIRYKLTEENGLKCLVLQYTKMRFIGDPSIEGFDSYLNYQKWFFEDGSIELRIGNMNLENSPGYSPGEGFFLIFEDGDLLIPITVDIGLANPEFENGSFILGKHDDFEVVEYDNESGRGIMDLPPEGWVFRFEPKPTTTSGLESKSEIILYPNPVNEELWLDADNEAVKSIEIIDMMGRTVLFQRLNENRIDLSNLSPGVYSIIVRFQDGKISRKIIKN